MFLYFRLVYICDTVSRTLHYVQNVFSIKSTVNLHCKCWNISTSILMFSILVPFVLDVKIKAVSKTTWRLYYKYNRQRSFTWSKIGCSCCTWISVDLHWRLHWQPSFEPLNLLCPTCASYWLLPPSRVLIPPSPSQLSVVRKYNRIMIL